MNALAALADDTRRQIVERLAQSDLSAGQLGQGFAMSQPAISRHLKVLRDASVIEARTLGQQRIYSLKPDALDEVEQWLADIRQFWSQRLDALATEIERGKRTRRKDTR